MQLHPKLHYSCGSTNFTNGRATLALSQQLALHQHYLSSKRYTSIILAVSATLALSQQKARFTSIILAVRLHQHYLSRKRASLALSQQKARYTSIILSVSATLALSQQKARFTSIILAESALHQHYLSRKRASLALSQQ